MSKIEWTNETWNPIAGCSIVSAGCTNCYAMTMARRLEAMGTRGYDGLTRESGGRAVWTGRVNLIPEVLDKPKSWKKPRMIFVNSMSDLFHPDVPDEYIEHVFKVMLDTPQHTYQILTKRPFRMYEFMYDREEFAAKNIWLGVSVESGAEIDRIYTLQCTHAAVRFVSFEPLIRSVLDGDGELNLHLIDWVIVGGESGHGARPMQVKWIDEIWVRCQLRNKLPAFFFKQWGSHGIDGGKRSKKANGRIYRGRTWDEMPITDGRIL